MISHMKEKTSSTSSDKELKVLRREIEKLKEQLAQVQKLTKAPKKSGKVRVNKLVVEELEVVDSKGNVVASIGKTGVLKAEVLRAREVELHPYPWIGTTPGVEIRCATSGGELILRSLIKGSKQKLHLSGHGSPLRAFKATNETDPAVQILSNTPAGGAIDVFGTEAGSKAKVRLRISPKTKAGQVYLTDDAGTIVSNLP